MRGPQFARMLLAVEQNESADPIDVDLLSANTVMLEPNAIPQLIEQPRRLRMRRCTIRDTPFPRHTPASFPLYALTDLF